MELLLLAVALLVILLGAELFTNGIEWLGHHLDLAEGAVGSVLAAVGTALPETMIPLVAILFATRHDAGTAEAVGVGAILGAPFMLATLAMFVTGAAAISLRRRRATGERLAVDTSVLGTDVRTFFLAYALAVGAASLPPGWDIARLAVAAALVVVYVLYVRDHLAGESRIEPEALAPLRFGRLDQVGEGSTAGRSAAHESLSHQPRLRVVNLQVGVALGLIVVGAIGFVEGVKGLSSQLGIAPAIMALVIAPVATELPEKLNSVIWVRQGKDTLALGNITGAMVFQSCIPTIFGLLFAASTWHIDPSSPGSLLAFASAAIAFASTAVIFLPAMRRGRLPARVLLLGGVFYVAYLALVVAVLA